MRRFGWRNGVFCLIGVLLAAFKAESFEVQNFTAAQGKVDSKTNPDKYTPGDDKYFSIQVSDGHKIKAEFTSFKLNGAFPNCSEDWVELFSDCDFKTSLGKLCSTFQPFHFYVYGNCLGLKYHTKTAESNSAFVLEYDSEILTKVITEGTPCSKGTVKFKSDGPSSALLHSTNWPQNHPKDDECTFEIEPPKDYKVRLYFLFLDMESNPLCETLQDIIIVKVANTTSTDVADATEKEKICQDAASVKVWDSGKHYAKVFIDVEADGDSNVGKGFLIGYVVYTNKKDDKPTPNGGGTDGGLPTWAIITIVFGAVVAILLSGVLLLRKFRGHGNE